MVARALDKSGVRDPLETWDEATVKKVVEFFMDERFPTIVVMSTCSLLATTYSYVAPQAMNKIDMPDADKNITRIMRRYDQVKLRIWLDYQKEDLLIYLQSKLVLTSALAENFLRKMHKQRYINYVEGTDIVETKEDLASLKDEADREENHVIDLLIHSQTLT